MAPLLPVPPLNVGTFGSGSPDRLAERPPFVASPHPLWRKVFGRPVGSTRKSVVPGSGQHVLDLGRWGHVLERAPHGAWRDRSTARNSTGNRYTRSRCGGRRRRRSRRQCRTSCCRWRSRRRGYGSHHVRPRHAARFRRERGFSHAVRDLPGRRRVRAEPCLILGPRHLRAVDAVALRKADHGRTSRAWASKGAAGRRNPAGGAAVQAPPSDFELRSGATRDHGQAQGPRYPRS